MTTDPPRDGEMWTVVFDGAEYARNVSHRCPNIGRHTHNIEQFPGCACHPNIPQPCPDCYAVEVLSRKVPWEALGRTPQSGSSAKEGPT